MKRIAICAVLVALLAGCATQNDVTLLPRGEGNARGSGVLNRVNNELRVTIGENNYRGTVIHSSAATTGGLFSPVRTTYTNQANALLIGDTGQLRCDFGFDAMYIQGTGVCVDYRNVTYDMLIK